MGNQRAFDFGGAHAVARDIDDIIDPPGDPPIAIGIAPRAVAGEIAAGIGGEIGLEEARMIVPDGAHLPRPALRQAQIALGRAMEFGALGIDEHRHHAEQRQRRRAGLERRGAGQRADQRATGFGLPPGVDDRAAAVADDAVIPFPGFGVDRLADAAEQADRGARGCLYRRIAVAHQRPQGSGRGVEDVDAPAVADLPEAADIGVIGHAFEHQRRRAIGERAINDIAVPGYPADIGGAPEDFAGPIVEDMAKGHRHPDQIAAGGVQHALGFAG